MPAQNARLQNLITPSLILDETRMTRNIDHLAGRASDLGVTLRPHLKTAKCIEVAHRLVKTLDGAMTVSTLAEAEAFAKAGFTDILYAVGIGVNKLDRVTALRRTGCDLSIALDSPLQAEAVAAAARASGDPIPVLIEIDSDGHRSGLRADDPALIEVGRILHEGGADLRGVMTHAGESYFAIGAEEHARFAVMERDGVVNAAKALRAAGLPCPVVSVGSTPTAHGARDLSGVTEMRAGVFTFFDLVMAGIGVCTKEQIALSVLTTVIGHQPNKGWVIIDAGWMAMSRDRGTSAQRVDQGYGVVCDANGTVLEDLIVIAANQEHGTIAHRNGDIDAVAGLPVGTLLRILPNHACATAAQHAGYHVIPTDETAKTAYWERFRGW